MHRFMLGLLVAALWCSAQAEANQPVEGRDFIQIKPTQPTAKDKVEVVEFFSYQCPHCNAFSTPLRVWEKKLPQDVAFRRESVSIGHPPWEPAARTFYTLQALGKLEALDSKVFDAIHKQGVRFDDPAQIASWMAQHDVPAAQFRDAYSNFSVETGFRRGETLSRTFRIPSIPTVAIDGKYLVVIDSRIDYNLQLANVDMLIARARAEKKLPSSSK
jgi:protein dithiol oxidoreductase (disulfide-forming)